jgi:hypothetical protein
MPLLLLDAEAERLLSLVENLNAGSASKYTVYQEVRILLREAAERQQEEAAGQDAEQDDTAVRP